MTREIKNDKSNASVLAVSDVVSVPPAEMDFPGPYKKSLDPNYPDVSVDAAALTARAVVEVEKKTILLPDFSQMIVEHRHMSDDTVDVFIEHHHTDGTTTYLEKMNVPESEITLDGLYTKDLIQDKGCSPVVPIQEDQDMNTDDTSNAEREQHQERRKRHQRIAVFVIITSVLIVLALLYSEFFFFPAIVLSIVAVAIASNLTLRECSNSDGCTDSSSDEETESSSSV